MITSEAFLTDTHFPEEDPACWNLVLQVLKKHPPDLLWLNGDILDFKSVSSFLVRPDQKRAVKKELDYAKARLSELRRLVPKARMVFREGNHDRRLQNYIYRHADELGDLEELTLSHLLRLDNLDCEFIAGDVKSRVGKLYHLHGDEVATGSANPARQMLSRVHDNVIFGHIHKFSVAHEQSLNGGSHVAWSIGTLQTRKVDFDFHPNWDQGFAMIQYTKSGLFHIDPIEVFAVGSDKCAMVFGQLFTAK